MKTRRSRVAFRPTFDSLQTRITPSDITMIVLLAGDTMAPVETEGTISESLMDPSCIPTVPMTTSAATTTTTTTDTTISAASAPSTSYIPPTITG